MPANLLILNKDETEISVETGVNLGVARKGYPLYKEMKIKNTGNVSAKEVLLTAVPLNIKGTVTEEEFNRQTTAASWKTFSFSQEGPYSSTLSLGSIKPNGYVEGKKSKDIDFKADFSEVFKSGNLERGSSSLKLSQTPGEEKDGTSSRVSSQLFKNCRDVEVEFNLNYDFRNENGVQDTLVLIPVRMNSKNTKTGYLFSIKYTKSSNRFSVSIWSNGKGIENHYDRDYGTKIFEAEELMSLDKNKKINLKVYNDTNNRPCFEFKYGGVAKRLGKPGIESSLAYVARDSSPSAFVNEGEVYIDFSISSAIDSVTISNMTITTEENNQILYVRTLLDDRAEDKVSYNSAVAVSYIED